MVKSKRRLLMSWTLVLVMLLNVLSPFNTVYAASVENNLTNLAVKVSQNGTDISEGGTITSNDPISVEISFDVPVQGDHPAPSNPIQKGDTATFQLSSAFKVITNDTIALKMGSITVGHVSFSTDPNTKMVNANVVFDGDDEVFNGTDNTVKCKFSANFTYDASGDAGNTGDHLVTILEKTYTVKVPAPEIQYQVTKSGIPDMASKSIEWTVNVSATQAGAGIDLSGYQFSDDLSAVGTYLTDSFKVGDVSASPTEDGNKLSYTFSSGSTSPQTIKFKTEIPDGKYYSTGQQSIGNKAQLLDHENNIKSEGQTTVSFTPKWIEKAGTSSDSGSIGTYNPKDRTITWTITANQMGATLNNVVITDLLPSGLTLKSASWAKWNGSAWVDDTNIAPNVSGEYALGKIDSKILLTILTSVPDEDYTTASKTYTNSAKIRWDGLPGTGIGTGNVNVGIGYNAITKSGVADTANRSIHWTVNVNTKNQSIPDLKVYDLLVYGSSSSGFNISKATGFPAGINQADLTPRYDQKYIDSSFEGDGLNITVYPIMQGDKQVADLLEITGFSTTKVNTFTFDAQVVNPDVFAGNKTSQVWNTASLFSANKKLNTASNKVDYPNNMLAKEMLKRESISDPAQGVNNKTTNASDGFDYVDKSVIFRLSVNAGGMDLSNMTDASGQILGAATVTDTLPTGWEFTEIAPGKDYLIFAGNTGSTNSVTASSTSPLDTVTGLNSDFTTAGVAKFTFSDLNAPYVLLVKAKPTDDTAAGYFNANKTTTVRNNLALNTEKWTPGVTVFQDVSIASKLLEKSLATPAAGELRWTVDYKPYNLLQTGTKLEDTLPVGIDLRTDSNGKPVLSDGNITAYEMTLNPDGSYTLGTEVALKMGENLFYDNTTRTLSFLIPDSAKAYRFSYLTDVTGEPGTVSNKVSLYGDSAKQEETAQPYVITSADGEATLQRSGWIVITKTDGTGAPLAGAEFSLFASDNQTVIREGVTGSDGTVIFRAIPDGEYVLRETAAPAGYTMDNRAHSVTVTTTGGTVLSSIDGKNGKNANAVTIKNYLEGTVGNLTISKTVAGNAADQTKKFNFKVTFVNANDTYDYTGHGVPDGTIKSGDTISLAHGQSITITGLPVGASYEVKEDETLAQGYSIESTESSGTISSSQDRTAAFVNIKLPNPTGSLTINKTVTGQGADLNKKFDFTVTLTNAPDSYLITGAVTGTLRSGDIISLANGESITITGLPEGAQYAVSEADYTGDGYTASSEGASGVISASTLQTASFVNHWSSPLSESGMPKTGDNQIGSIARLGLFVFLIALVVLFTVDVVLRRKNFEKGKHK